MRINFLLHMVTDILLVIWSLYCTGRYLTSFILYNDLTSQLVSLGLGTSTGLSFAFTCCSLALSLVQTRLLFHGLSTTALLSLRATLQYLSSLFFLTPSITNLILLIVWRNSQMPSVQITHRCKLDVDLVWSAISSCNHPLHSWGTWISLAVLRFALSLCIVVSVLAFLRSPGANAIINRAPFTALLLHKSSFWPILHQLKPNSLINASTPKLKRSIPEAVPSSSLDWTESHQHCSLLEIPHTQQSSQTFQINLLAVIGCAQIALALIQGSILMIQ